MHIQFLGAAQEVTGSKALVDGSVRGTRRRFLVDCGMFQGARDAEEKNLSAIGFAVSALDFVILTHAHIDHSGLLPRLAAQGFHKPIYCTPGTYELLEVLLMDSAHLQAGNRQRAEMRLAKGNWRGALPQPLYTTDDVAACLKLCKTVDYRTPFSPVPGVSCVFEDAGHILGAAIAVIDCEEDVDTDAGATPTLNNAKALSPQAPKRLVFSGDIGMRARPLMHDPTRIARADVLVVESTYGNRLHRSLQETEDELVEVVSATLKRGGNVVMPAFAVGRTQEIVFLLLDLIRRKRLPYLTIFVDSPMASAASRITERYLKSLDAESQHLHRWFQENPQAARLRFVADVNESKAVNQIKSGAVIISASGMCEAGRIVHHLYWNLPRPQSAVVITGFQALGTRGRALVDRASSIRLLGEEVPVKASIHTLGALSAHADQGDLLWWLKGFSSPPKKTFIVHGEETAAQNFASVIREELNWPHVVVPQRGTLHPA